MLCADAGSPTDALTANETNKACTIDRFINNSPMGYNGWDRNIAGTPNVTEIHSRYQCRKSTTVAKDRRCDYCQLGRSNTKAGGISGSNLTYPALEPERSAALTRQRNAAIQLSERTAFWGEGALRPGATHRLIRRRNSPNPASSASNSMSAMSSLSRKRLSS